MPNQSELKKRVYQFYKMDQNRSKHEIFLHFSAEGEPKKTIYRFINDAMNGVPLERKKGSGKKSLINTSTNRKRLKKMFDQKKGVSLRKAAKKIGCHHSYISKMLKGMKKPIRCYKRTKRPKRTPFQMMVSRGKCGRMFKKYRRDIFVMDDESYFTLANATLSGNDTFYSSDRRLTPNDVFYWDKAKFDEKVLLWIAISARGIAKYYIMPSKQAINQTIYLDECIKKRLVPFIKEKHRRCRYVFWPDLASSHYANSVQNWLYENKIRFVPKYLNPANVPEVRPIEDFFAYLKRKVYRNGWCAKNVKQLEKRIIATLSTIDHKVVQKLMANTSKRLDRVRRFGFA